METRTAIASAFIRDRLFPLHCLGCDAEGAWVCAVCNDTLLFLSPVWQAGPPLLSGTTAVFAYDQKVVHDAVYALKYAFAESVMSWIQEAIAAWLEEGGRGMFPRDAVLVPVPLHRRRYAERGFNQAELLARVLGDLLSLPVAPLLIRSRNTDHQARKTRVERLQNVADAFALSSWSADAVCAIGFHSTIILVDDVATTGSTFAACARPLYERGFTEIYGFSFGKET